MTVLVVHTWVLWVVPIAIAVVFGLMGYAIGHAPVQYLVGKNQPFVARNTRDEPVGEYDSLHVERNLPD